MGIVANPLFPKTTKTDVWNPVSAAGTGSQCTKLRTPVPHSMRYAILDKRYYILPLLKRHGGRLRRPIMETKVASAKVHSDMLRTRAQYEKAKRRYRIAFWFAVFAIGFGIASLLLDGWT